MQSQQENREEELLHHVTELQHQLAQHKQDCVRVLCLSFNTYTVIETTVGG